MAGVGNSNKNIYNNVQQSSGLGIKAGGNPSLT